MLPKVARLGVSRQVLGWLEEVSLVNMLYTVLLICNRLVYAFTCTGILPSQYIHFIQFSGFGVVGKWYTQAGKLLIIFYSL